MSKILNELNKSINRKLGLSSDIDSVKILLDIYKINQVLPESNMILAKRCYEKLLQVRTGLYDYTKNITEVEYSRCLDMLITKLVLNIQTCIENDEIHKIQEFTTGKVDMDELAKKNIVVQNNNNNKSDPINICESCKIGEITIIDGYKHCQNCCAIY
jgi:hypothetical protein